MSGYKNFAIAGAGLMGGLLADELLKAKSAGVVDRVVLLSRPSSVSKLDVYTARGATVISVEDYSSVPDVTKALTGIDVVISTIPPPVLDKQVPLSEAAKAAGVQLVVPSEFGLSTDEHTEGELAHKAALDKQIRALGLATARFFVGMFGDSIWIPLLNLDLKSGSVEIGGDGSAQVSFTSAVDIARFVAYVLTNLPREDVKNRTFRIEGERKSFNDIFAAFEKKHGTKLVIKHTPMEELKEAVKKNPYDLVSYLRFAWATGLGVAGSPLDNDLFPGWDPKPVIHYL